jgi:uroporphyrinogen-III decarboxylase
MSISQFQEGFKRFGTAMKGIPDRVPVYAQIHEFAMNELGVTAREFYSTADILTRGILEISEKYGLDLAPVDYDVYNIEAEALGQALIWDDEGLPDVNRDVPLITGPADLSKIKTPDFDTAGRCPQIIEAHHIFQKLTSLQPTLQFCAPFSLAANIRGIEQLLFDLYDNPDFAGTLFDRITEEVIAPWILYQRQHFPEATNVVGSDATSSLPIVSLDILKEWSVPYVLRLRKLCGPEVQVPNWVGESYLDNPAEMLDLKLAVTSTFIEGQDPDVEKLGPDLYKSYAEKHNVPLILGVGAGFLALGTPQEITERVQHYLNFGGQNGRFALYLCNLGADTPPENLRAAVDAVRTYGVY